MNTVLTSPWRVCSEKLLSPDQQNVTSYEQEALDQLTIQLHEDIELALRLQLSFIESHVIGEGEISTYGIKEIHPDGRWLYKWKGIPLVEVTSEPSMKLVWKIRCLPLNPRKVGKANGHGCWR